MAITGFFMGKNTKNTTAKERMLKKIRQALLQKRDNPFPHFQDTPLYAPIDDPLTVLFAERFTENGGHFVYCESELHMMESLLGLIEQKELRKIHVWEPGLQEIMMRYGLPFIKTDAGVDEGLTGIDLGITSCEALIGRMGAVMLGNANSSGRRLSSLASTHVVLVGSQQILPDIKDGMDYLKQKYKSALPSSVQLLSKDVYVFLLDY